MAGAQFNPPPHWPVPRGWTPPSGWSPDPSWPPAPPNWQFWLPAEPDRGYHVEQRPSSDRRAPAEKVPGAAESFGRRHWKRIAIAAGAAVALVAGTVTAVTWLTGDADQSGLPEHMLASTFPTQPDLAWTVRADQFDVGSDSGFATPEKSLGPTTGALVVGNHVIARVWRSTSSTTDSALVSVNASDGNVEWSVPDDNVWRVCSPHPLGDTLPCLRRTDDVDRTEVQFVDLDSGQVASRSTVPFNASLIDSDGDSVYIGGFNTGVQAFTVAKGSREDPVGAWKTTVPAGQCEGYALGDGWAFDVSDGLVWGYLGGGASAVLRQSDGKPIFDHDVADVWVADGTVVSKRCEYGGKGDSWDVEVSDAQGNSRFNSSSYPIRYTMDVHRGAAAPVTTSKGQVLDPTTGTERWHLTSSGTYSSPPALVGNVLLWPADQSLRAYDIGSGDRLWSQTSTSDHSMNVYGALTDGTRMFMPVHGGIDAVTIVDGTPAWSLRANSEGPYSSPMLYATPAGMLMVNAKTIALLKPTGSAASIPAISGSDTDDESGGGTKMVTKCGRPPQFVPQAIRAESGALVITVKIVAKCPGGDVLSGSRTRIAVTSGGQNVASADFDLSGSPIVVAPGGGGSSDEPSVTHEFVFPVGTFWRLPVSTNEAPTNGATQRGRVDLDASTLLIDCEEDGVSSNSGRTATTSKSSTAAGAAQPKTGDDESASFDALRAIANADRPFVAGQLADRWVPQLSSKRPGLVADGITWNNAETLREHLDLRLKYPEVRLLWSGDWSTFSATDFWVTIAGVTFSDADGALGWCRGHNLDSEHCYAKLVSTTHPIDGSTAFNR